jgi:carboxypeptidase C (cathepsin A)
MATRLIGWIAAVPFLVGPALAQSPHRHHSTTQPAESSAAAASTSKPASMSEKVEQASEGKQVQGSVEKTSTTQHTVATASGKLAYRATAANMLMKDETGKTKATVFFVAYELLSQGGTENESPTASGDGKPTTSSAPALAETDAVNRPITFVFNGGPGAAAVWLHLGTAGPRRIKLSEEGFAPPPPYGVVDNEDTWLDASDLVFIDPVGTGFSRPAEGEKGEQFYGVTEDVRSVGEFIRLYLTLYNRWSSPKFLAGESYGTTRAAALSQFLLDRHGIALNGISLISCVLNFQTLRFAEGNDLPYILYVPTYAAIAWYHHRLVGDLPKFEKLMQEVERWSLTDYAAALARGDALSSEDRDRIARTLSQYTGLSIQFVLSNNLRIETSQFQKQLLASERRIIGRFDGRVTGFDLEPGATWPRYDPSLSQYLPIYSGAFNDYVRRELKYQSVLPYEALSDRVRPWKYGEDGTGYLSVVDDLRSAMAKNPFLRIMFASAYYDLATPHFATWYTVNHLDLGPLRGNIIERYYSGGHMMYHEPAARVKLHEDMARFIRTAVPSPSGRQR